MADWEEALGAVVAANFRCVAYVTKALGSVGWTSLDCRHMLASRDDLALAVAVVAAARAAVTQLAPNERETFVERLDEAYAAQVERLQLDTAPSEQVLAVARRSPPP